MVLPSVSRIGINWLTAARGLMLIALGNVLLSDLGGLSGAASAGEWTPPLQALVPLIMASAIACFTLRIAPLTSRFATLVTAGLAAYAIGDCLLLTPSFFVGGLLSYVIAHLCYFAAFRQDVPTVPCRRVLLGAAAVGVAMYFLQFPQLPMALRCIAAAYFAAMSLMVAQALGRAMVIRDRASALVAAAAVLLLASDCLITIDHFATPLPLAGFWIHATYYTAQILVAWYALPTPAALHSMRDANVDRQLAH